jgi:hypothetical protein
MPETVSHEPEYGTQPGNPDQKRVQAEVEAVKTINEISDRTNAKCEHSQSNAQTEIEPHGIVGHAPILPSIKKPATRAVASIGPFPSHLRRVV